MKHIDHVESETNMSTKFHSISNWINAGNMATGMYLICAASIMETDKAIGVPAQKINSCGNLKPATCWLPKSKVEVVSDDFYAKKSAHNILIPEWLMRAKMVDGYEF